MEEFKLQLLWDDVIYIWKTKYFNWKITINEKSTGTTDTATNISQSPLAKDR